MINNPKDIAEILEELDKITFEQLDKAIKNADKEYEQMQYDYQEEIYNIQSAITTIETNSYNTIESQQIEVSEISDMISVKENFISEEEGENKIWMKELVLVA